MPMKCEKEAPTAPLKIEGKNTDGFSSDSKCQTRGTSETFFSLGEIVLSCIFMNIPLFLASALYAFIHRLNMLQVFENSN